MATESSSRSQREGKSIAEVENVESSSSSIEVQENQFSHVFIKYPPLSFNIPHAAGVMYDDGNRLLLVPALGKVYAWPVSSPQATPSSTPQAQQGHSAQSSHAGSRPPGEETTEPQMSYIGDGPILAIRFSLDCKMIAVQRTPFEVEFVNVDTCMSFKQRCKRGGGAIGAALGSFAGFSDRILGFFWTDCPTCDVIFITTGGLELYSMLTGRVGLKMVDWKKKPPVAWYVYTHESRLLLFATGSQNRTLNGYQFSVNGAVKLPKFEANFENASSSYGPSLSPEDIRIATIYGRIYCLQVDRTAKRLNVFQFYRDAVIQQSTIAIYSERVATSVVDNILLVHQLDTKVVLLYDLLSGSTMPIAAPLPLTLRGIPPVPTPPGVDPTAAATASASAAEDSGERASAGAVKSVELYEDAWVFVNPDLVLDHANGLLWRLRLDLPNIAASWSDPCSLLTFLQRRRFSGASRAKALAVTLVHSLILDRAPVHIIGVAFEVTAAAFAAALRANPPPPPPRNGPRKPPPPQTEAPQPATAATRLLGGVPTSGGIQPAAVSAQASASELDDAGSDDSQEEGEGPSGSVENVPLDAPEVGVSGGSTSSGRSNVAGSVVQPGPEEEVEGFEHGARWGMSETWSGVPPPAISPDEMFFGTLLPLHKEGKLDAAYMAAVTLEFVRGAAVAGVALPPGPYVLIVDLLLRDGRVDEVRQLLDSGVLEPSLLVASALREAADRLPVCNLLALHTLRRIGAHRQYVLSLVNQGKFLAALRYMRQHNVENVPPSLFLDGTSAQGNPQKLAAVWRFCSDFVPGFLESQYHKHHTNTLLQMTRPVPAPV